MELDKAIQSRTSVRKFKSKKPDWQLIVECINAARYAPMAGGSYTLKFILVDDPETIQKLADCAQQDFIAQAQYVVVVCSNPSRTKNAYGRRGEMYCKQQAGAAIQNFLLKIEESGLSTCWIGHFTEDEIKRGLKIPEDIDVEALFPIGYEYEKKRTRKAKIDLDNILYFNKYKQKKLKIKKFSA
jgi:nitroreductase